MVWMAVFPVQRPAPPATDELSSVNAHRNLLPVLYRIQLTPQDQVGRGFRETGRPSKMRRPAPSLSRSSLVPLDPISPQVKIYNTRMKCHLPLGAVRLPLQPHSTSSGCRPEEENIYQHPIIAAWILFITCHLVSILPLGLAAAQRTPLWNGILSAYRPGQCSNIDPARPVVLASRLWYFPSFVVVAW